jgi:hypothetical protein
MDNLADTLDQADEDTLAYTASDEALEAAAVGTLGGLPPVLAYQCLRVSDTGKGSTKIEPLGAAGTRSRLRLPPPVMTDSAAMHTLLPRWVKFDHSAMSAQ